MSRPDGVPEDAVDLSGEGGLCKKILVAGDESEGTPFEGAEVQVHYVGTLLSDGSKFDSSRDRPGNFKFKIGQGQVIKGWDKGVATMHKGEKAELFCRSDYAYGDAGSPPKIPGGATLKFEVELLSWAEPKKERWEMSASEKLADAKKFKAEGGAAFKAGDYSTASEKYNIAFEWVEFDNDFTKEEDKTEAVELRISCLLNNAQCALKCKEWAGAITHCTAVLAHDSVAEGSRVKALFRRGSARIKACEFDEAKADLLEACKLDPKSKEIREAYASIKEAAAAAKKADAGLYANMIKGAGGAKKKPPPGVPADAVDLTGEGGLCKRILVEGDKTAGTPPDGATVQVHYVGTLLSDGSKFDSSRDRPGNFKFPIGEGRVIQGWDKGVATMHKGEKAELFCRSDFAYGDKGSPPKIPGGATLKFEVELLSWEEQEEVDYEQFANDAAPSKDDDEAPKGEDKAPEMGELNESFVQHHAGY